VHSLSHLDLPWSPDGAINSSELDIYPQVFKTIILDFTAKQEKIQPYIVKDPSDILYSSMSQIDLRPFKNGEDFLILIKDLTIEASEIIDRLRGLPSSLDLSDYFILIRTDWSFKFNRFSYSLNNPSFEGISAFLCHPFMSYQSALELKNFGIRYFGHDLPSLENPLYFADAIDVHPIVQQARELIRTQNEHFDDRVFDGYFLKVEAVKKGKLPCYYLKNLNFRETDKSFQNAAGRARRMNEDIFGDLLLLPLPILRDPLGVACEAYFRPALTQNSD